MAMRLLLTIPILKNFTIYTTDVHLSTILQQVGFNIMAYVDDLLVVGDSATTQASLKQFQQHLELKHTSHLTRTTPLEFLGKTIELQADGTIP
eukprot:6404172-Amphidinium_carterae.2